MISGIVKKYDWEGKIIVQVKMDFDIEPWKTGNKSWREPVKLSCESHALIKATSAAHLWFEDFHVNTKTCALMHEDKFPQQSSQ